MSDWFRRARESRRVRNVTLGTIGFLTLGSCGGALLANYTVDGMTDFYASRPAQIAAHEPVERDWSDDLAAQLPGEAPPAEIADARY